MCSASRTSNNYGVEKFDRVKKTLRLILMSATIVRAAAWVVYMAFPLPLIRIFGTESALYEEFAVKCFHNYMGRPKYALWWTRLSWLLILIRNMPLIL
ncbi:MAG: hypothetical protein HFI64_11250 [Lachnospiraceae bacterium]|nr:hypothetical protein [Lachnospiraceae bacterium]